MPSKDEHVAKAEGNEGLANAIQPLSTPNIEWKLVILFYAAMHYVEAYLAKVANTHLRSHTTRDGWMVKESNLKKIATPYNHLKFYGYNSRYEVTTFSASDLSDAIAYLEQIKNELKPLIN